jgi:hypothetical protein
MRRNEPLLLLPVVLAGCTVDVFLSAIPKDPDVGDTTVASVADTDVEDSGADTDAPADTPPPADTDVAPTSCAPTDWVPASFTFPPDDLSCSGTQLMRFDPPQGLWVGLVSCGGTAARIYLSASAAGPFLPALDGAGNGQDHCELVDPSFTIPMEDDITSGGCTVCATSPRLSLEGVAGWYRLFFGEPFNYVGSTAPALYQTSRIDCAYGPIVCVPTTAP